MTTTTDDRPGRPTVDSEHRALSEARIAVVIPSYRVAPHIAGVVAAVPSFVAHIVVVDDCSPDDVAAALRDVRDPRLVLVRHEENQGVGGALKTGYDVAARLGARVLVKIDGDGQMNPKFIPELVRPILDGESDYTKGNRFLHPSALRRMPAVRRIGNVGLTFLAKLSSGYWEMFDPSNGYTAIHVDAWKRLRPEHIARRYFFETSMLIELGCQRAVVRDVPMPARYADEKSSLSVGKVLFEFPPKLLAGFLRRVRARYFLHDFTPVSLFVLVGSGSLAWSLLWGGFHWWRSAHSGVPARTGTIMIAVVTLILGVQFLLQAIAMDVQNAPTKPLHQARWIDDSDGGD
jgi:glycosyltransferase involved in cell wall biosynthesis